MTNSHNFGRMTDCNRLYSSVFIERLPAQIWRSVEGAKPAMRSISETLNKAPFLRKYEATACSPGSITILTGFCLVGLLFATVKNLSQYTNPLQISPAKPGLARIREISCTNLEFIPGGTIFD